VSNLDERLPAFRITKKTNFHGFRHIAYNALDPEIMLRFYIHVFGLRKSTELVRRSKGLTIVLR